MKDCPHAAHGLCGIASRLANRPVTLDPKACSVCSRQPVPFGKNAVTASLAIKHRDLSKPIDRYLIDLAANRAHLAGHILEREIHRWLRRLNIKPPADCNCAEWISKMNKWGVVESLEHVDEIVSHLLDAANKTYLGSLTPRSLSRPMLRRMVRQCLLKELS